MNTVLVTGANGFIGKALCKRVAESGNDAVCLTSKDGDIAQIDLETASRREDIEHVFHLAAKTFIPDSWRHPREFYSTSVMGTENVLEYCRRHNAPLTYVSAYLYGIPGMLPVSEESPLKPNNPYAHSKYMAEELCRFYAQEFGVKITVIRPFNIFGIGQNLKFLIPHIIDQALHSREITVQDLLPKRDYLFLDDFIDALLLTMNPPSPFAVYNIGSGYSLSVQEIINIIQAERGVTKPVKSENSTRKNEIPDVVADISKANQELNWFPKHSFAEGIRKMLETSEGGTE